MPAIGNIPGDCGEGLHLASVTWSWLVGNVVENNVGGILITDEFGPSAHNVISHNIARNNRLDCGITLPSHNALAVSDPTKGGVYDNLVIHNLSEGNGGAGSACSPPSPGPPPTTTGSSTTRSGTTARPAWASTPMRRARTCRAT